MIFVEDKIYYYGRYCKEFLKLRRVVRTNLGYIVSALLKMNVFIGVGCLFANTTL